MGQEPHIQNTNNDFDIKDIVRTFSDHQKGMGDLSERIKLLENKLGSHEKIADTICDTSEKIVKMQALLGTTFIKQLQTNPEVQKVVTDLIDKADRDYVKKTMKRFGFLIYTGFIFILGVAVTAIIGHYIK